MKCLIATAITSLAGTTLSTIGLFANYRCCSGGEDTALSKALLVFALPGMAAARLVDPSGDFSGVAAFFAATFIIWLIIGLFLGWAISRKKTQAPVR